MAANVLILGAGVTGLGAGLASGFPIYETESVAGGLCASYYKEGYRFEVGGGHWIFGAGPSLQHLLSTYAYMQEYERLASVYFANHSLYVPYPIQNHLSHLGPDLAAEILTEIVSGPKTETRTMLDWLYQTFGDTLTRTFFGRFNKAYTAGLCGRVAPQDSHKSPIDIPLVIQGAFGNTPAVGYNTKFMYPKDGLDILIKHIAQQCNIQYNKRVTKIDTVHKAICFEDGSVYGYKHILSTLPLNQMLDMTGLQLEAKPDPHTSVLVINIGAERGPNCPDDHWLYIPDSKSGFHRVGFYSNVDKSFLPEGSENKVSLYVETAYACKEPMPGNMYQQKVIEELQEWGFIGGVDVISSDWVEVAYTWAWLESTWRQDAIDVLESCDIIQLGRYGRWKFQGISESLREGLVAGAAWKG